MTKYRGPWNAAGMRHRQTPRAYKPSKPVGTQPTDAEWNRVVQGQECQVASPDSTCYNCGWHVCSCQKPTAKTLTFQTAVGPLTVVSHPNHFGPPTIVDHSNIVRCYPHGEAWDRLGPDAGCRQCREEKRQAQPTSHQICKTHDLWSVNRDDTCASCTVRGWLGKKAKAVEVLADLQPESPVYNSVLEAMKATRVSYRPFLPAYLDGIDEALERASERSASSGLTGKDQDRKSDLTQSMGVSAESGKHVSKSALPEEVMFEGRPLRVGDFLAYASSERPSLYGVRGVVAAVFPDRLVSVSTEGSYLCRFDVDQFCRIDRIDTP